MKTAKIIIITAVVVLLSVFAYYKIFFIQNGTNTETSKGVIYTCSMHPQIIRDHPGLCPICGMDLIIKTNGPDQTGNELTKNINEVVLSPTEQVLANLQTEKVEEKDFPSDLEYNGSIKYNESGIRHISTPVSGNILKQYITFEGQYVRAGSKAFDLYSPEIYSTEKEYILALENYERSILGGNSTVIEQAKDLLNSTLVRLSLFQLSKSQISELEKTKQVKNSITIYSKYSGIITKKYAHEGHWAPAGEDIYDITDVSTLWAVANINESDIGLIRNGQQVKIRSVAYPDEDFYGKVNFINPSLQADTRTLEVRIDVPNRGNKLRPDMFVKVFINSGKKSNQIAVPVNSVVRTGKMDMVYIKTSENTFVPRMVSISGERSGYYLISSGLSEGEIIVSSAGFLLDSESQIRNGGSVGHDHSGKSSKNDDLKINENQNAMKDMKK
ncbi:efflux RND transporter periplasmic adaptor subunit [soil metagenome]